MKNITLLTAALFLTTAVFAQAPQSFSYQAVARDNSGKVLANQPVSFRISILNGSVSGTTAYSEIHTGKTTNTFGLVELEIGKGTPQIGTFSAINWGSNTYFVKIEMDLAAGSAYQLLGTSQLLSVPYALYAKNVENKDDADPDPENELINKFWLMDSILNIQEGENTFAVDLSLLLNNKGGYYYLDEDQDGYGNKNFPVWVPSGVVPPANYINNPGDCNDKDKSINPEVNEICNDGIDNNCDGNTDCSDNNCLSDISCSPVDIIFLVDKTSGMSSAVSQLNNNFYTMVSTLQQAISDLEIGLVTFQDFPSTPYGATFDVPFQLLNPVTNNLTSIKVSLSGIVTSGGGDEPESGYEALYQIATGAGVSNSFITIPPSNVGFRDGSKRIVVLITNSFFHQEDGYLYPANFNAHNRSQAFSALSQIGAAVISANVGAVTAVRNYLEQISLNTDATIPVINSYCYTGLNGTNKNPVNGKCPLVFDISSDGSGLSNQITAAILEYLNQ